MSDQTNLPPSASELLLQARLDKALTLDQVSLQTRIPRDLIQALEDKNWSALPGAPYARAFCKTLAQAYDLDPELVLAGLRNDMGMPVTKSQAKSTVEISVASVKEEAETSKTPLILAAILAVALVLVLAATRLAFKPSGNNQSAEVSDSLKTDSLDTDTTEQDSLGPNLQLPQGPVGALRKTVTIRLMDTAHPAFILYMRQGISRIRKKSLTASDTLEFNPDTGILVRNLSKQQLKLTGIFTRDSVTNSYFRIIKKSDSVRFETMSEAVWEEKTGSILEHKKHKKEH